MPLPSPEPSLQKHEQAKSYLNRWGNTTTGCRAVHVRFITGTRAAFALWKKLIINRFTKVKKAVHWLAARYEERPSSRG